jgi:hypothetical protein
MQPQTSQTWADKPLTPDYLLDSGLLFEINRTILHLFGIAIAIKSDEQGNKTFALKDFREKPEELVFDKNVIGLGTMKLENFLKEFGHPQMDRRAKKLGWSCQHRPWSSNEVVAEPKPKAKSK